MSHAEALQTLHPAAGATEAVVGFVERACATTRMPEEARHYARRHLLDTVGVMIAGAGGEVATRAEAVLAAVRPAGRIPVPGPRAARRPASTRRSSAAPRRTASSSTTATGRARCIRGCVVVPAVLALGFDRRISGQALIEATRRRLRGRNRHRARLPPDLRQRGFHPTAAVGVFGAVMAAGKLRGLSAGQLANALGIAASSAAGLFAFVNGGADIKRLHAGHASREGLQAALLAEQGVEGPPDVIEARDGFMQAFAFGRIDKARAVVLPPAAPYGITDCYIKPYACCRHIQPAVEALIGLLNDEKIAAEEVQRIDVETYRIAAEHAETGWDDFASAQLSFPYLMSLGAAIPRHQGRAFQRRDAARSVVRGACAQAQHHGAAPRSTGSIRNCARRG